MTSHEQTGMPGACGRGDTRVLADVEANVLLRTARERICLSLERLALLVRVEAHILKALEDGGDIRLPPVMFASGFAAAYARAIKLPAEYVALAVRTHHPPRPSRATQSRGPK